MKAMTSTANAIAQKNIAAIAGGRSRRASFVARSGSGAAPAAGEELQRLGPRIDCAPLTAELARVVEQELAVLCAE
jgi:hypothetical protein